MQIDEQYLLQYGIKQKGPEDIVVVGQGEGGFLSNTQRKLLHQLFGADTPFKLIHPETAE